MGYTPGRMKKFLSAIAILASLMPAMASADVVTSDDIERLLASAFAQNDGCKLLDFALKVQGGGMNARPEWRTVPLGYGITMRVPWSPYWYLVGKQIPWTETYQGGTWGAGRFATIENCGLKREYRIGVVSDWTLAKQTDDLKKLGHEVSGTFSLNGKKAALWTDASSCGTEELSVEAVRGERTHVVTIGRECSEINGEVLRMAASLK